MISEYIKSLLDSLTTNDPVYSCKVYLNEGCAYVDGADCNMKTCSMLSDYKEYKEKLNEG
jgi:hypothetical protein